MAKNLETNIIIGGKTTSGFNALSTKLAHLGGLVDQIGGRVREWETDAVEVYKDYETLMLEAEGAMTTQYKSASERAKAMSVLEEHVADWAANSIFHTDDMARAVNEAAHAGWDLQEMLEGIPVAMNLAQAGNITLSEGLDDLIKTLNATGMGTDYASTMVDQWTLAANSSATTVSELGDALKAMGSTAQFADTTDELFTMLAVLADTGTVGSRAGTLLRNSMLRLIAPTKKAGEAMEDLEVTEEELEELTAESGRLEEANRLLEEHGFSAYDANGKLKPFLRTFKDLDKALEGMDEEERNNILASIFPTRTITGAMALLKAAAQDYDGLLQDMAESEGYAARIARIQTSGLMGSTEILKSKEEELKRKVGEILSDPLKSLQNTVGDMLDWANGLPEADLAGLTGAATALAGAGPGLIMGSIAVKTIAAHPIAAMLIGAAMGAAGLAAHFAKLNEINFEDKFGTMELDLEQLGSYVEGTAGKLTAEQEAVEKWSGALADAQQNYENLTGALAEELMFDTLTGKQLTQPEKDQLTKYGKEIGTSLITGLNSARMRDMDFLDVLFGDMQTDAETDAAIMSYDLVNAWYTNLMSEAEAVSEELRLKLASALDDGIITEEERDSIINETVNTLNEIQAAISDRMDRQAYFEELSKAGAVSWDSASEYLASLETGMNQKLADNEALYHREWGIIEAAIEDAVKNGTAFDWNGESMTVTEANREAITKQIRDEYNREWGDREAQIREEYGEYAMAAFNALMNDSEYGEAWKLLQKGSINEDGSLDTSAMFAGMNAEQLLQANDQLTSLFMNLNGIIGRLPAEFFQTGTGRDIANLLGYSDQAAKQAGQMYSLLDMYGLDTVQTSPEAWGQAIEASSLRMELDYLQGELDNVNAKIAATEQRMEEKGKGKSWWYDITDGEVNDYATLYGGAWESGGLYAKRDALQGQIAQLQTTTTGGTEAGEQALAEVQEAVGNGVTVGIQADGGYEAMNAQMAIMQDEANRGVTVPIRTIGGPGPVKGQLYARGGRATEASIFGEGDTAEWAIPEEHTERTAKLLSAAAQASGFGWDELLARNGGLNGDSGNVVVNTTYAPTINAGDASGVQSALDSDKERVEQVVKRAVKDALAEQRFRDQVEVYV